MYHDYPRHYSNREEQHTMTVLHITATERSNVPWLSTENTVWPEEQRTMTILDIKVTERSNVPKWVSNLLFYAQSTIMVISGCQRTKTVHRQYSMTRGTTYHDCPQTIQYDQRSNVPWLSTDNTVWPEEQRTMTVHRQYSMTRGTTYHDCPQTIQCNQRNNVPWLSDNTVWPEAQHTMTAI